jgi:hypothetical protein
MVAIKTTNFSYNKARQNATFDTSPDGLGWGPGYVAKREGLGVDTNSKQYQDNFDKIDWSKK